MIASSARLAAPHAAVAASFRAAIAEFAAEGRFGPGDDSELAVSLTMVGDIGDDAGFARYLGLLHARASAATSTAVRSTTLWWVDGAEFLGRISIRHRLTGQLRRRGGHIGYDVRPSARGRGHAVAMLRAALPVAANLGIAEALLTCSPINTSSRKVIEAAGGVRSKDGPDGRLRYQIPTDGSSARP